MAKEFEVKSGWETHEQGQKFVAKAINKYGRILAVASFDIPVDVGYDFVSYYGSEELKNTAENTTIEQVKSIAEASPEK